jgi:hypothetical protein
MLKPSSDIRKRIEENAPRLLSPWDENNDEDLAIPPYDHHHDGAPPAARQQQPPRHSLPPPNVPQSPSALSTWSPSPHPGPSHQTHVESDDSGDDVPRIPTKDKGKQKEVVMNFPMSIFICISSMFTPSLFVLSFPWLLIHLGHTYSAHSILSYLG